MRIKRAGERGGAASIRVDDPNPDIKFVETGLTDPDPSAGKYEIAVQADRLPINGRNPSNTAFETIVVFQRLGAGGNIGFRATKNKDFGRGQGVIAIANAVVAPTVNTAGAGILYVSGLEWDDNDYRASVGGVTVS